jgi:hypothetical protein
MIGIFMKPLRLTCKLPVAMVPVLFKNLDFHELKGQSVGFSRTAAEQFLVVSSWNVFHRNCNIHITINHSNIQCFGKIPDS